MKNLLLGLLILVAMITAAPAHAKCMRIAHGTKMGILGHEQLYDIECNGHIEERGVEGIEEANRLVDEYSADEERDERINESLRQANEAARMDQDQAEREGWHKK